MDIEEKRKKKVACKGFQDMDLRETQELIDITSKEQTEDNLREMSASEPMLKKMKKQCQKQTKEIDNGWPDMLVCPQACHQPVNSFKASIPTYCPLKCPQHPEPLLNNALLG